MVHEQNDLFEELRVLRVDLQRALPAARSFEEAAQLFVETLSGWRANEVVLARMYATLPFGDLPPEAREALRARSALAPADDTTVLTLLGSHGVEPSWRSRRASRNHGFIPLLGAKALRSAPMLARLLVELGVDLRAFEIGAGGGHRLLLGGLNGVFYVADAATDRDEFGRLVVPDQAFVADHGVRTVWGVGGLYPNRSIAACIVFLRRELSRAQAERRAPLITTFKLATTSLVSQKSWFSP